MHVALLDNHLRYIFSPVGLSHLDGHKLADELHAVLFHMLPGTFGHVLVKPAQKDGSHHNGDVQAQPCQEARALQGHVGGTDHQRLARAVGQGEKIIAVGDRAKVNSCKKQQMPGIIMSAPHCQSLYSAAIRVNHWPGNALWRPANRTKLNS